MPDESTPLLQFPGTQGLTGNRNDSSVLGDRYHQFCHLVGVAPLDEAPGKHFRAPRESLWYRATQHRRHQVITYALTATFVNGLLLSQVVLGAALTGLGASDSSRVLITVFGALNTVIAGLIAFLKSRGQPVRSRMFRDDLERVVDEIENSATMWRGISKNVHGYDSIDTDDTVTVRSEVARLTRLYDRAVKNSTMNDPDNYAAGVPGDPYSAALRSGKVQPGQTQPTVISNEASGASPSSAPNPLSATASSPTPVANLPQDPDESPASSAPAPGKPKAADTSKANDTPAPAGTVKGPDVPAAIPAPSKEDSANPTDSKISLPQTSSDQPTSTPALVTDPVAQAKSDAEEEPASSRKMEKHTEDTSKS
ncbi:hypothetical protein LTR62_005286 [Meristemomyces frigidus]|uniref:SMODS and SLOG-associating 2TM effector domain-containing protein n=1 Tax=Meristemomyces frigidus TaxID=1508187 RepID=A0AAN7TL99_9PEZI|nr:hypothetical protein LTR62_005286 [Meristemomyces frigidus]